MATRKEDAFFNAVRELAAVHGVKAFVVAGVVVTDEGDLVAAGFGASKFQHGHSGTAIVLHKLQTVANEAFAKLAQKAEPETAPPDTLLN